MKVCVSGASGFIASALIPILRSQGHDVVPLVRRPAGPGEISWDPTSGNIETDKLEGVGAVVHLAGAGVGDRRWTADYKEVIRSSRVDATAHLAGALSQLAQPPSVLLSGSAIGYFGSRGNETLVESSGPGTGFLASVCRDWEAATHSAADAGIRVVNLRTGVVLSAAGGALAKQLRPFKMGLGARLGSGQQHFSWITRRDVVGAITFLMDNINLDGPFNLSSPDPVTNAEFTRALGAVLHRPAKLAVPALVLRRVLGAEMAAEFLLASQRVEPERLIEAGYQFQDPTLPGALITALADS